MIVELEELKNSTEKQLDFEFNEYIAELKTNSDVTGKLSVSLQPYGLKVWGHVTADLELECDRCLKKFSRTIQSDIEEEFLFGTLVPEGVKEYEIHNNGFVNELQGEDFLDLTDVVYQSILLELPSQLLCSDDCSGNEAQKIFKEGEIEVLDPRLEQFKNININASSDD